MGLLIGEDDSALAMLDAHVAELRSLRALGWLRPVESTPAPGGVAALVLDEARKHGMAAAQATWALGPVVLMGGDPQRVRAEQTALGETAPRKSTPGAPVGSPRRSCRRCVARPWA